MKIFFSKIKEYGFLSIISILVLLSSITILSSCSEVGRSSKIPETPTVINTNPNAENPLIVLEFFKGKEHNHPLMAVWTEDLDGKYIETLYIAESIAKGMYIHGDKTSGKWMPGPIRRPATLPYWAHKRGVKEEDGLYIPSFLNPMPDAISSATPKSNFVLNAKTTKKYPKQFFILFEINQSWDWNEYWTNNKFPDDKEYKTSSQPSLVYRASINTDSLDNPVQLKAIGHGHYSGANGELFEDLSTLTTALKIAEKILVRVKL
ncbi:MAG: hypothetical protein RBS19_02315 [Bacteroidales bacterium]|nr:hypothetical protein [Bacteroidales bacterium]MDY0215768.1 hypothetical protein [Bacteroidales bacterium]